MSATEIVWIETKYPLFYILENWVPGSYKQPWSWDDEEEDIRVKMRQDSYQNELEEFIRGNGVPHTICLGTDGRIWDGHHRLCAARNVLKSTDLISVEYCVSKIDGNI